MRRIALALTFACALSAPALAQDSFDARLALSQRYVAETLASMDMPELVRSMYRPVLDQLAARGTSLSQEQIDQIDALYQSTMLEPLRNILLQQDRVMAEMFTLEEIEALLAFYSSPVGRSVMTKLPQLVEAQQPAILAMVQSTMPRIMPEMQRIIGR